MNQLADLFPSSIHSAVILKPWLVVLRFNATLTHYQTTNFRPFQTKEFADVNFKFDEDGRKLSKRVENTVGKGEIARCEQFSFSHSVF